MREEVEYLKHFFQAYRKLISFCMFFFLLLLNRLIRKYKKKGKMMYESERKITVEDLAMKALFIHLLFNKIAFLFSQIAFLL